MRGAAQRLGLLLLIPGAALGGRAAEPFQCLRANRSTELTVCLSCHDGSLAQNFALSGPGGAGATPCPHPVKLRYAEVQMRKPREFVSPARLDPELRLLRGEVQCVTCHLVGTDGAWSLIKTKAGQSFCLNCHRR